MKFEMYMVSKKKMIFFGEIVFRRQEEVLKILDVSHLVCFAKTFTKYPRNVKYEKCMASLGV